MKAAVEIDVETIQEAAEDMGFSVSTKEAEQLLEMFGDEIEDYMMDSGMETVERRLRQLYRLREEPA